MALDFDAKRAERFTADRDFTILGETFTVKKGVRPSVMAAWEALDEKKDDSAALLAGMQQLTTDLIVTRDHDRWVALLEEGKGDEDIDLFDLEELIPGLLELATGRPFASLQPSGVTSEGETTGQPSTDTYDSPEEPSKERLSVASST